MTVWIAALCTLGLIVATSLLTYEILRVAWFFMSRSRHGRSRVLYALAAAFIAHIICISLYGFMYFVLATYTPLGTLRDATPDSSEPFTFILTIYFSAATYSSLGFGDIVPTGDLRLIAVIEGLNGLLLIGWSVAHSFLAMEEFWEKPLPPERRK